MFPAYGPYSATDPARFTFAASFASPLPPSTLWTTFDVAQPAGLPTAECSAWAWTTSDSRNAV